MHLVSPQSVEVRPNGNVYEGKLNTLFCISHVSKPVPFMVWHIQCEYFEYFMCHYILEMWFNVELWHGVKSI